MENKEFTYEEIQTLADFFEQVLIMDLNQHNTNPSFEKHSEMPVIEFEGLSIAKPSEEDKAMLESNLSASEGQGDRAVVFKGGRPLSNLSPLQATRKTPASTCEAVNPEN